MLIRPSFLDGVVIKGLNVVMIDSTTYCDPKIPGAVDEILNFENFGMIKSKK
ncbi:MAG: hypothetical protein ACLRPW_08095 [Intestinibacter sp.]